MLNIIRTNKFDFVVDKIRYANLFIYLFMFITSNSSIFHSVDLYNFIASRTIKLSFIVIFLVIVYDFFRDRFTRIETAVFLIIGLVFSISYLNTLDGMNLVALFYIIAFKDKDLKQTIKLYLFAILLACVFNIFTRYAFNLKDFSKIEYRNGREIVRYAIGFGYTAFVSHTYLTIVVALILLNLVNGPISYIILLAINGLIFFLTSTRNSFIVINLVLLLHYLCRVEKSSNLFRLVSICTILMHFVGSFALFVVSLLYNPDIKFFSILNKVLNNRVILMHKGIQNWGITLFGQYIDMNTNSGTYNVIDSTYMSVLLNSGLLVFLIWIFFATIVTYMAYKKKDKILVLSIFAVSLHGLFDTGFISIGFNPTLFYFYTLAYNFFEQKTIIKKT